MPAFRTVIVVLLLTLSHSRLSAAFHDCPMPKCERCLPSAVYDAPGIGFDLSISYGVSAVHRVDNSKENVAKVSASQAYIELMRRLSNARKPEPSKIQDYIRWINKKLGRAATSDVAILANLISDLKEATELSLAVPIDKVVFATPCFPALTKQDISDAAEHAGITSWLSPSFAYPNRIGESNAVFAAYGNGICQDYKDLYECWDEEEEMERHRVFTITFTRHALSVTLETLTQPFRGDFEVTAIDFDSGLNLLDSTPSSIFWPRVRRQIVSLYESANRGSKSKITKVLLSGESVMESEFPETLREALNDIFGPYGPEISSMIDNNTALSHDGTACAAVDPLYASARGAAHYARWRQEVPWQCKELSECDQRRRMREERGRIELR